MILISDHPVGLTIGFVVVCIVAMFIRQVWKASGGVQMSIVERARAYAKIKKLRKMTTAAGCTPDEATSAAAKIAEIMSKYGMNEGDLSVIYRPRSAEEAIYRPPPPAAAAVRKGGWAAVGLLFGVLLLFSLIFGAELMSLAHDSPPSHHTRPDRTECASC